MEILNREKLKVVLERWKEHPSITGLMEKFSQLQSYTNKNYKSLEENNPNSFEDKKNSQGGNRKRINMTQMYEKSGQNLT